MANTATGDAMTNTSQSRWIATVTYRTGTGPLAVDYGIEELDEIADLVEGEFAYRIESIVIVKGRDQRPGLTIEKAETE